MRYIGDTRGFRNDRLDQRAIHATDFELGLGEWELGLLIQFLDSERGKLAVAPLDVGDSKALDFDTTVFAVELIACRGLLFAQEVEAFDEVTDEQVTVRAGLIRAKQLRIDGIEFELRIRQRRLGCNIVLEEPDATGLVVIQVHGLDFPVIHENRMRLRVEEVAGRRLELGDVEGAFAEVRVRDHRNAVGVCNDFVGNDFAVGLGHFVLCPFQRRSGLGVVFHEVELNGRRVIENQGNDSAGIGLRNLKGLRIRVDNMAIWRLDFLDNITAWLQLGEICVAIDTRRDIGDMAAASRTDHEGRPRQRLSGLGIQFQHIDHVRLVVLRCYGIGIMLVGNVDGLRLRIEHIAVNGSHLRHFVPADVKTVALVQHDDAVGVCESLPSLQDRVIRESLDFELDVRDWLVGDAVHLPDKQRAFGRIFIGDLDDRFVAGSDDYRAHLAVAGVAMRRLGFRQLIGTIRNILEKDIPALVGNPVTGNLTVTVIQPDGFQMELGARKQPVCLLVAFVDLDIAVLRISEFEFNLRLADDEILCDGIRIRILRLTIAIVVCRRLKLRDGNLIVLDAVTEELAVLRIGDTDFAEVIRRPCHVEPGADDDAHLASSQTLIGLAVALHNDNFGIRQITENQRRQYLALLHLHGLHRLIVKEIACRCLDLFRRDGPAIRVLGNMPTVVAARNHDGSIRASRPIAAEQGTVDRHLKDGAGYAFACQAIDLLEHDFRLSEVGRR